jgi:Arm DNA-binding domain
MAAHVSIKFYLLNRDKTASSQPIYMRITFNRKKAELHTGFTTTKKDWNQADQNTWSNNSVNQQLSKKKSAVYSFLVDQFFPLSTK